MKTEIKYLPCLKLVGETYIFVGAYKDPIRKGYLVEKDFDKKIYPQLILPIGSILDDNYFVNSEGILEEREPYCKHCGSKNVLEKDIIGDYFIWRMEFQLKLKLNYMNVRNVKRNSKLNSLNTGENSVIIPIK